MTLLCLGQDGHLAIETGIDGSCEAIKPCSDSDDHGHDHESLHDADKASNCSSQEECCGDCVDFELELEDANISTSSAGSFLDGVVVAPLQTPLVPLFRPLLIVVLRDNKGPPGFQNAFLESFSTIRLLI